MQLICFSLIDWCRHLHQLLFTEGTTARPKPCQRFHEHSWSITSVVCRSRSTCCAVLLWVWPITHGPHHTWGGGCLSTTTSWSVGYDVKWWPATDQRFTAWVRGRERGAPSARVCAWALPVSAPRSFFGLFTTVVCNFLRALPIHSVSALNLLNPKKQVTPEAPYAGGLIKEVLSVVMHCWSFKA